MAHDDLLDQVAVTLREVRSLGVNINDGTSAKFRCRSMAFSAEHAIKKDPDVTTIRIRMTVVTDAVLADPRGCFYMDR